LLVMKSGRATARNAQAASTDRRRQVARADRPKFVARTPPGDRGGGAPIRTPRADPETLVDRATGGYR